MSRREADLAPEEPAQERGVLVPDARRDLVERKRAGLEQALRLLEPKGVHVLDWRHAKSLREAPLERPLCQPAQLRHRRNRRVFLVVPRNPLQTSRDDGVVHLPAAHQRGERLLADIVPVEQLQARHAHRFLGANEPRDEKQREVVPR